jgi:enediyne biosynthesis protein E4
VTSTRRRQRLRATLIAAGALALAACPSASADRRAARDTPPLFELLSPGETGIAFVNEVPDDTALNIINFLQYYNGGGVAAGDVNGDGLPDLYFTANLGRNRLYLNRGGYRFEDVTDRAGVAGVGSGGWTTGVAMADVNGDGHLDLYVSAVSYLTARGRNILYINRGDGTFADSTAAYGLDFAGFSTQAAFFDYDGDRDLDMYLLNYSAHTERGPSARPQREVRHPRAGDRLFRNEGKRFVDVSAQAGIYGGVEGYGLGVVASDLNADGCPDLYVANDFQENDFLYLNNCDGTFTESIARATGHTSQFAMGVDAADVNDDLRPDLAVVDMLPEREEILKSSANAESFDLHRRKMRAGYHPQFARNTLLLNRGVPPAGTGPQVPRFSDVAFLAGVSATDWSWAPLFADLDDDGDKDLFVTNGIVRRPNDFDYIEHVGQEAVQASLARGIGREDLALLKVMPQVPLPNYAFRNEGGLTFTNVAEAWGLAAPDFSNGAVYVDLNNSGSLDLVVNRINAPAAVYRNRARERTGNHALTVRLRGLPPNTGGIGARVYVRHGGRTQMLEQFPTRGFQSSVDPRLHFGLGPATRVDSLVVIWPNRTAQVLTNVPADSTITLSEMDSRPRADSLVGRGYVALFRAETARLVGDVRHRENDFVDFAREPLMPHLLSTEGPALAAGDVDGDGLDDLYLGGARGEPGRLLRQQPNGTFRPVAAAAPFQADSAAEDVDAAFFDANGDGRQDLYVVSGGNELWGDAEALQDRLYLGDGRGTFRHAEASALPRLAESGSCVAPADFDGDGDVDLFVGRRAVARGYGLTPRSYLLENDGGGRFRDVTVERGGRALAEAGMVTSAAWVDADGDRRLDLVVVGEWMPVRVFRQEPAGRFAERTAESGLAETRGWWNSVAAADLNGDGRADLVLGNLGLNSYLRASREEPARLYLGDFFQTGVVKQILTSYKRGVSYPVAGRDELLRVMPQLRSRFPTYKSFGASRVEDILPRQELAKAVVLEAQTFASAVAINAGNGAFTLRPLPAEAQLAPVYASLAGDYDGDGRTDLLVAGNFFGAPPLRGRYDASYGLLLRGLGDGRFEPVEMERSGVAIEGQVRDLKPVRGAGGRPLIAVARNDDALLLLQPIRRVGK